jgi:hypothetical protein
MIDVTASDTLREVIGRALVDSDFRDQLFDDRSGALGHFDLSPADLSAIDRLDCEALEAQAAKLGSREIVIMIAPGPPEGPPEPPPEPSPGPPTPPTPPPTPAPAPPPKPKDD